MTEAEKKMKRYMNAVERKLRLPADVRRRVMADLASAVQSRREVGRSDEEIYAELGTAAEVAAELNGQMEEFLWRRSPWRWAFLALAALGVLLLLRLGSMVLLTLSAAEAVSVIGGADGPTQIFVAGASPLPGTVFAVLALVVGVVGFFRLSRLKR